MLSAPRRSEAVPNPTGKWAVFSANAYSFDTQESSSSWNLLNLENGTIETLKFLTEDVSEVVWIPGTSTNVLYVNGTNEDISGGVALWYGDLLEPSRCVFMLYVKWTQPFTDSTSYKLVASLPGEFSGLKVSKTASGNLKILLNALAYRNGLFFTMRKIMALTGICRHCIQC